MATDPRIAKLRRLARDPGATSDEAATARSLADKLQARAVGVPTGAPPAVEPAVAPREAEMPFAGGVIYVNVNMGNGWVRFVINGRPVRL